MAGIVTVESVRLSQTPSALRDKILELVESGKTAQDNLKAAVRNLLRTANYKPTGRGKPASEYLANAAKGGRFPFINNLVDVNNYISLQSGLPVSLLDYSVTGDRILLRDGIEGEKYVFNDAGQEIELNGLIAVCRNDTPPGTPLGTPVKDSMQAKLKDSTTSVIGVVYCPRSLINQDTLDSLLCRFADMLEEFGGGRRAEKIIA